MPGNRLSFHVTDSYRERLQDLRTTYVGLTRSTWSQIDLEDLNGSFDRWRATVHPAIIGAQLQAVTASHAYLAAFLTSELGEPASIQPVPNTYTGLSRTGRSLSDVLGSPLTGVRKALSEGRSGAEALRAGLNRAILLVGLEIDHAAQAPLLLGIDGDERFDGWQRAVRGTCGACLAAASGPDGGLLFARHPHCQCVAEPRVGGVPNRFPRPTGASLLAAMTDEEQDAALGPAVAEKVREGIPLENLIATSPQATTEPFITQAPAASL